MPRLCPLCREASRARSFVTTLGGPLTPRMCSRTAPCCRSLLENRSAGNSWIAGRQEEMAVLVICGPPDKPHLTSGSSLRNGRAHLALDWSARRSAISQSRGRPVLSGNSCWILDYAKIFQPLRVDHVLDMSCILKNSMKHFTHVWWLEPRTDSS